MKIEVVIDDNMLDEPVRKAVAQAINEIVKFKAHEFIRGHREKIENAVEVYLNKKLTDDKIKSMIDNEVIDQLASRIRDLES